MRKIQFVSLVVISLLLLVSQALAFGEIRYTDRPLNLRDARSPQGKWIGNMYPGQKVRIDHLKDGWVAVYEPEAVDNAESACAGYANVKYLKEERTRYEPKEWGELKYAVRAINVRTRPSVKGRKILTLKSWEHVLVDFPEGDWIMVFKPGATIRSQMNAIGYSSAKYFRPATDKTMASVGFSKTDAGEAEPETAAGEPEARAVAETAPVSGEGQVSGAVAPPPDGPDFIPPRLVQIRQTINVHAARTTGSSMVRTLKPGDRVKVGQLKHGWYELYGEYERVHSQSRPMGYVLESLLDKGSEPAAPRTRVEAEPVQPNVEPVAVASTPENIVDEVESKPIEQPIVEDSAPKKEPISLSSPSVPAPGPVPEPEPAASEPAAEPEPVQPLVTLSDKGQQTMVIDRTKFSGAKRPDPTPDKSAHGYQYRFLEKSETRQLGEPWITLKVFLATTKLPDRQAMEDFATTLWKEHRRVTKKVAVLIYLPGMDTEDLAYGVVKFDDSKLLELWVRKATLFGTKFM